MTPGLGNRITDVAGLHVGHASDHRAKTGVTVLMGDAPFVAAVDIMGGAPGTRETDLLAPETTVGAVDALVLSGGSAFGLAAADGVMAAMAAAGRGFAVGDHRVPIVPAAILFDLASGGIATGPEVDYAALGRRAAGAAGLDVAIGSVGAGTGATCADIKGGLGTASIVTPSGVTIGALVAANPVGSPLADGEGRFWAAPFEIDGEFGGRGVSPGTRQDIPAKFAPGTATTIAIVATDAVLTKSEAKKFASAAHDGLARSIVPSHTPLDGDLVFAAATGRVQVSGPDLWILGHHAATCLARAVARAIHAATPADADTLPSWMEKFGRT